MKQDLIPLAAVLLLASNAVSQRPPDLKQLLPDEYSLYISADGERVRASSLWKSLTRTVLVGEYLQSLPVKFGIDVDDVDRMLVGSADRDAERGKGKRISTLFTGKHALRGSAFVDAMARSGEADLVEETIGGRKAWVPPEGGHGPGTADLGPGTLWLASRAALRERLGAGERARPAKPCAALEALFAKEGGAVFVALDGTFGELEPLQRIAVAGGLRRFRALCVRIELTPGLEADVTLVPDPQDDVAKVKDFLQEKLAQGAEELKALKLQILAKQCSKILLEVRGRDVGCVFKLAKGQESALIAAAVLWVGVATVEVEEVVVVAEAVPASRPASQPATKK